MNRPTNTIRAKLQAKTLPGRVPLRARVVRPENGRIAPGCDLPLAGGPTWELEFPGGQIL